MLNENVLEYIDQSTLVKTTGNQTISGNKTFSSTIYIVSGSGIYSTSYSPTQYFLRSSSNTTSEKLGCIFADTQTINNKRTMNQYYFREYSYDSTTGDSIEQWDQFRLPIVDANKANNNNYEILTSKSAVTIAQGGTGATTAAAARTALGAADDSAVVKLAGDQIITGKKTFSAASGGIIVQDKTSNGAQLDFSFSDAASPNGIYGKIYLQHINTSGRLRFRQYSGSASAVTSYYDQFQLPATSASKTGNNTYDILTSKAVITVTQGGTGRTILTGTDSLRSDLGLGTESGELAIANGGTGATTAAGARESLRVLDAGQGVALTSGANVDNLAVGTVYYSASSTVSSSLQGTPPTTGSGFKIITIDGYYGSQARPWQIAFGANSNQMWRRYKGSSGWEVWRRMGVDMVRVFNTAINSGTGTLSETAANFQYLIVYGCTTTTGTSYVTTICRDGETGNLGWAASGAYIEFSISGTTLTVNEASSNRYIRYIYGIR